MRILLILYYLLFNLSFFSCAQEKKVEDNSQKMFTEFIQKEKFNQDKSIIYPGLKDKSLKPILTK